MTRSTADRRESLRVVGPGVVLDYQRVGIVNLARRFSQVLMSAVSEVVPQDGLRYEFGLLVAISHVPNLEQKNLAAVMSLDVTTIGQLVDVLEGKGLVRRISSSTDRRVKLVEITKQGRHLVAEFRPSVLKAQNDVLAPLSEKERLVLTELMSRVVEANPHHDRPGAGRRPPKPKPE
jgi:MarR family transcriptional regulator, lower aerobic nicotinate degradation pathway regulator